MAWHTEAEKRLCLAGQETNGPSPFSVLHAAGHGLGQKANERISVALLLLVCSALHFTSSQF